jgi:hypothetical protein
MDPRVASPDTWVLMTQTLNSLVLFVILAINTAVTFLIAHAVIPSLVGNHDVAISVNGFRKFLYPLFAISGIAAAYAFYRAISLAIMLMEQTYPRFAI